MTREQLNQVLNWLDAGKLQIKHNGEWVDYRLGVHSSIWYPSDDFELYRIKPTPTLRPWRPEEVPVGGIAIRHRNTQNRPGLLLEVGTLDSVYIWDCGRSACIPLIQLSVEYTHSLDHGKTWLPCGVVE